MEPRSILSQIIDANSLWGEGSDVSQNLIASTIKLLKELPGLSMSNAEVFNRLIEKLGQRAVEMPEGSYTTKLLRGGAEKIGAKVMEEAGEVVEAAGEEGDAGKEHFTYEVGDLLYHLFVLMVWRGISLDDVARELARREGTSGIAEKESRNKSEASE